MGLLTLSEMQAEVYTGLGQRNEANPSTVAGAAFLTQRLRDAYRHVCSPKVYDHPALHNLQVDFLLGTGTDEGQQTESFALPTRLRAIELVRNEQDGYRLGPDRFENFMDRGGRPRLYTRRGQRLYVPVADNTNGQTLRVHYWGRPLPLAAAGAATEIGEEWDSVVVTLAISFAYGRLGDPGQADYHQALAAALIDDNAPEGALEARNAGWMNDLSDTDPYQARS